MTVTLGAQALLDRVAQGTTTAEDANRLRMWLFPSEQTQIVKAYMLLCCNAEKARAHIAADLRLNLAVGLLRDETGTMAEPNIDRLLADTLCLYDEYQEQHGYERDDARHAAIRDTIEGLNATLDLMREGEL